MSDFEDIQRLLRLKRHERPPESFVEDFVHRFQQRQRAELLQQSARGLLWERVTTYFEGLFEPKWRWAGATAAVLFAVFITFRPGVPQADALAKSDSSEMTRIDVNGRQDPVTDAEVERYLISKHFEGGFGNESPLTPVVFGTDTFIPQIPLQNGILSPDLKLDAQSQ